MASQPIQCQQGGNCVCNPFPQVYNVPALATKAGLRGVRLMCYYPSANSWTNMWTNVAPTDAGLIADWHGMVAIGANTVRLNVFANGTTSYPTPSAPNMARLEGYIAGAAACGLRTQITMFDWNADFIHTTDDTTWLNAILAPYHNDSRIAFIDLKNELDIFDTTQKAWLDVMWPLLKTAAGTVPCCISNSQHDTANRVNAVKSHLIIAGLPAPDLYNLHFYGPLSVCQTAFDVNMASTGGTPLIIGETGASALQVGSQTVEQAESVQADYIEKVFQMAKNSGVASVSPWTYQDFTVAGAPSGAGLNPDGYLYGLTRVDGFRKGAYHAVVHGFAQT